MTTANQTTRSQQPPQGNIPRTRELRDALRDRSRDYAQKAQLTPPLTIEDLREHAKVLIKENQWPASYEDYTALMISNGLWRNTVAGTPYDKRLLLLPRCLRDTEHCQGKTDEIGLLCEHCGHCLIDPFKSQAEALGYAVLVAEGSPIVMSLIETGQIEAVIGVSCLHTLERVYPYMEAGAVPGIAIPLLFDGCVNTAVDSDWIWEALYETSNEHKTRLDLESLRDEVTTWFEKEHVTKIIKGPDCQTYDLAVEWLSGPGKRWRPYLTAATALALSEGSTAPSQQNLIQAAMAVECFHKASLIHDDIEDGDDQRYGQPTLHAQYGIPIALNVGDYLVGEGYRLLEEADLPAEQRIALIKIAAEGHRTLCLGQGRELEWAQHPCVLPVDDVLQIFQDKTAPAFAVALQIGAVLASTSEATRQVLQDYSTCLGTAYQIRDDLDDLIADDHDPHQILNRPSILAALTATRLKEDDRKQLDSAVRGDISRDQATDLVVSLIRSHNIERQAADLLETYKSRAIRTLSELHNAPLKGLLRRVLSKIFYDFDIMGCCNDPDT